MYKGFELSRGPICTNYSGSRDSLTDCSQDRCSTNKSGSQSFPPSLRSVSTNTSFCVYNGLPRPSLACGCGSVEACRPEGSRVCTVPSLATSTDVNRSSPAPHESSKGEQLQFPWSSKVDSAAAARLPATCFMWKAFGLAWYLVILSDQRFRFIVCMAVSLEPAKVAVKCSWRSSQ